MDGIKSVFTLFLLMGTWGLCIILIGSAVLQWLTPSKDRLKKLNQLAILAAFVLCLICLPSVWKAIIDAFSIAVGGSANGTTVTADMTGNFINEFKLVIKLLLLGVMIASTIILILVIVLFLGHGLKAIFDAGTTETESLKDKLKNTSKRLLTIMKSPILIAVITWGILALFISLPFLAGDSKNGDLAETWKNGVYEIVSFGSSEEENTQASDITALINDPSEEPASSSSQSSLSSPDNSLGKQNSGSSKETERFYQSLIKYILLTVIVLGVVFAVFKLLFSIIARTFTEGKTKDLIDEYSGAIGVLSVGVAMLWTLQDKWDLLDNPGKLLAEFLKTFCVVMVIVALIILTLEIIRLMLDMREKLIRQEAKLLFVSLVGQVSLLLLSMLRSLYNAANTAMGNLDDDSLERVHHIIKEKVSTVMEDHLSNKKEFKTTFSGFEEKVTKVDEEEEL